MKTLDWHEQGKRRRYVGENMESKYTVKNEKKNNVFRSIDSTSSLSHRDHEAFSFEEK